MAKPLTFHEAALEGASALQYRAERLAALTSALEADPAIAEMIERWRQAAAMLVAMAGQA